ncbi:MAG: DsbA family oxidoreductase [Tetrasphaera sp.]|nr:DsbA family oxidoreductase [Tetrasphaera sp.]
MRIDVWSDFLCPFCHLGRRQLELALADFEHADDVDVIWHSFQLDRNAPDVLEGSNVERVADKYGVGVEQMEETHRAMAEAAAEVGLDFQWDKAVGGNSYAAHRLHHYARSVGREKEFMDRLMRGWYSEGASIGDHATLVQLATEAGLEEAAVREVLANDDFGPDVRTDLALANSIGICSVPTFVLDQKYGVSGAQGVDALLKALNYAWADQGNRPEASGGGCGGGCCGGGGCGSGAETGDSAAAPAGCGCGSGGCGSGDTGGGGMCGTHEDSADVSAARQQHTH